MSAPGAVQLFMFLIRCWTSTTVTVSGFCSGRFLWSALKSCNHGEQVLCVFASSDIVFQYLSFSAFGGSDLTVVFHCRWEYTLDGSLKNRTFIFFVSASLVYLLSLLTVWQAFAWQSPGPQVVTVPCTFLVGLSGSLIPHLSVFLQVVNFPSCGLDLGFHSHFPGGVCTAFLVYHVAKHFL